MVKTGFLLFIVCCTIGLSARAQEAAQPPRTTGSIDTTRLFSDQPLKSPLGATLRSAVLPGWGQLYNRKYVKSALVASLNGYLMYQILHNDHKFDTTGNKTFRDRRGIYSWYFGLSYLLTLVDAYVDAYLYGFDKVIDMDIAPAPATKSLQLNIRLRL